jgi:hypothetical protein
MSLLHEAMCRSIAGAARVIRESGLSGEPLAIAADLLEAAMDAVEGERLPDAATALGRFAEVRL